jgi:hypothetical protein
VLLAGISIDLPRFYEHRLQATRERGFSPNDAVFSLTIYSFVLPLIFQIVMVLTPALWGMCQGLRPTAPAWPLPTVLWVTICVTVLIFIRARFDESPLMISALGPLAFTLIKRRPPGEKPCVP